MADAFAYVTIHNIPQIYRSCDLRNFFSQLVETGSFRCFHYRHRPEVQKLKGDTQKEGEDENIKQKKDTCCCLIMIKKTRLEELIGTYNQAFWVTKEGETLNTKCFIQKIIVSEDESSNSKFDKSFRNPTLSRSDLREMIELRPPPALPAGNVGTPTKYILKQINRCQFPVRLIAKLGLEFPRMRAKGMYGSVSLDYERMSPNRKQDKTDCEASASKASIAKRNRVVSKTPDLSSIPSAAEVTTLARTTKGHLITGSNVKRKKVLGPEGDLGGSKEGKDGEEEVLSDDGEEWDRHEALHDDVTSQERTKERLFEEGMEVVWEKGGSGLVFYTDAQHWDETEGDFDAKTSDDWDIDMSGYYQDGAGDKDARDMISIQNSQALRNKGDGADENRIGFFEKFTKGVGRQILEKQGWKDGEGVGAQQGISEPIIEDWKHPFDRSGLGFRGQKLIRHRTKPTRAELGEDRLFSAVYDKHFGQDGHGITGRSEVPSILKYRKKFVTASKNQ